MPNYKGFVRFLLEANPYHDPKTGKFTFRGGHVGAIIDRVKGGGFTYDTKAGAFANHKTGYYVGYTNGGHQQHPAASISDSDVRAFVSKHPELAQPDVYLGGWRSGDNVFLDVSRHFEDKEQALQAARETKPSPQHAIYDIVNQKDILLADHPVSPTGETPKPVTWKTQKTTVQAGEYPESNAEVTQHVSHDGRFTITPKGGMSYKKEHGIRGDSFNKWRWSGYLLQDNSPNLPKWVSPTERHSTVASAKRAADRRAKRTTESWEPEKHPRDEEGKFASGGTITVRGAGAQVSEEGFSSFTRPGHFYRGMTDTEYQATVAQGKGVQSRGDYSAPGEGTSWAKDAADAESYVNFGHTDPRKTSQPTYIVEIKGDEGLKLDKDGYHKAKDAIPASRITRTLVMRPENDSIVGTVQEPMSLHPRNSTRDITHEDREDGSHYVKAGRSYVALHPLVAPEEGPEGVKNPMEMTLERRGEGSSYAERAKRDPNPGETRAAIRAGVDWARAHGVSHISALTIGSNPKVLALMHRLGAVDKSGRTWLPLDKIKDSHIESLREAWEPEKHPRQPGGNEKGGEFAPKGGSTNEPTGGTKAGGLQVGGRVPGRAPVLAASDRPLEGLPEGSPGPFLEAREVAAAYMKREGREYAPPTKFTPADPEKGKAVADAFEAMKDEPDDPKVKAAYAALAHETMEQWDAMRRTGIKVEPIDFAKTGDPYHGHAEEMFADVRKGHMYYFRTADGFGSADEMAKSKHPFLAEAGVKDDDGNPMLVNDVFRVVHDYFGHNKEGVGFDPDGEDNAWRSHLAMYSPLAGQAMTTETRGQTSWVYFGPHGADNREGKKPTVFADQKVGLMPSFTRESNPNHDEHGKFAPEPGGSKPKLKPCRVCKKYTEPKTGIHAGLCDTCSDKMDDLLAKYKGQESNPNHDAKGKFASRGGVPLGNRKGFAVGDPTNEEKRVAAKNKATYERLEKGGLRCKNCGSAGKPIGNCLGHYVPKAPKTMESNPNHDEQGRFASGPSGVGFHDDGTITLLHGTTRANADAILLGGFKPGDPVGVAASVEKEYGLPPGSVLNHEVFSFARGRRDLDKVHFTADPDIAKEYTVPEVLQDALKAAYFVKHPPGEDSLAKDYNPGLKAWTDAEGKRLMQKPAILAVTVPWSVVGDNAFGRKIGLEEYKQIAKGDLPHNPSIPISALAGANIEVREAWDPAKHPRDEKGEFSGAPSDVDECGALYGPGEGQRCIKKSGHQGDHSEKLRRGRTPKPAEPSEDDKDTHHAWAEKAGGKVNGYGYQTKEHPQGYMLVTDKQTGSTGMIPVTKVSPDSIAAKIAEIRDRFSAAGVEVIQGRGKKESFNPPLYWGANRIVLMEANVGSLAQEPTFVYGSIPVADFPEVIEEGIKIKWAQSVRTAKRYAEARSIPVRTTRHVALARPLVPARSLDLLTEAGWVPVVPSRGRFIEVGPGRRVLDGPSQASWTTHLRTPSVRVLGRFPGLEGLTVRQRTGMKYQAARVDFSLAHLTSLKAAVREDEAQNFGMGDLGMAGADKYHEALESLLLGEAAGGGKGDHLLVWQVPEGQTGSPRPTQLLYAAEIESGKVLYAAEHFPSSRWRFAILCPEGGKVWAIRTEGMWVLPGGHKEPGEERGAAAVREMLEETGLKVRLEGLLGEIHRPGFTTVVFHGSRVGDKMPIATPDEIEDVDLIDVNDLDISERFWVKEHFPRG